MLDAINMNAQVIPRHRPRVCVAIVESKNIANAP